MQALVADLRARGLPPIHMRIGLHTGRVVVGNVPDGGEAPQGFGHRLAPGAGERKVDLQDDGHGKTFLADGIKPGGYARDPDLAKPAVGALSFVASGIPTGRR